MRPSLLSAVALTIVALYALPAAAQDNQNQDTAEVEFEDQTMDGDMVVVARVVLPEGGFVVIHDDTFNDGDALGSVLGASEYLSAGEHTDVEVSIDMPDDMDGGTSDDNDTGGTDDGMDDEEMTLIAMAHMDTNDNQEYDFVDSSGQDDGPYTASGGGAVTAEAMVTKSDDDFGDGQDDGLDQPGDDDFGDGQDDGVGDGQDDGVGDGEEDTPGFEAVALLALLGAVAVFRRR